MDHIGKTIRRLREERGLNQAQLAVSVGTGPSAISQIENGRRNPNSETLLKLANALEVEVGDLFPKAQAPLPLNEATEAGPQSLMDTPQDEFLRALSAAESNEALLGLYNTIDAERTSLELRYREDETDLKAHSAYIRAVERRMVVLLTLVERGVRRPDPEGESLTRQAERLEDALLEGR